MSTRTFVCTVALLLSSSQMALGQSSAKRLPSLAPSGGFVPDSVTALRIGEAVLTPIFGEKAVEGARPFTVRSRDRKWEVRGVRKGNLGGSMEIDIAKKDARVLRVWRGK